jgi:hypothetical protein
MRFIGSPQIWSLATVPFHPNYILTVAKVQQNTPPIRRKDRNFQKITHPQFSGQEKNRELFSFRKFFPDEGRAARIFLFLEDCEKSSYSFCREKGADPDKCVCYSRRMGAGDAEANPRVVPLCDYR